MALRFLFVNIGYPPFMGGAQTYVQQLAESLAADGHQVTVLTTDAAEVDAIWSKSKGHLPADVACCNGVTVRRLPLAYLPGSPMAFYALRRLTVAMAGVPGAPGALLWQMARYTPWVPTLSAALNEAGPVDVVHGFAIPFESMLKPAADYASAHGAPFFVTPFLHTGPADSREVSRSYAMPHQVDLLHGAHRVIALTEVEREFLLGKGLSSEQVCAIPAGIKLMGEGALHPTLPDASRPLVLFLGAATYEKGALHLVQALQQLWAAGVEADLVMLGTATEEFRRYFEHLPEADRDRTRLRGVVAEAEKQAWLERCTLLAMPSRVDSFGLVFLEAWAHRKPVIGARAGGIPAVIDEDENGLLAPFGDIPALTAAIRRLIDQPEAATRLGEAGRAKLEDTYDWQRIYPRLLALYHEVVAA